MERKVIIRPLIFHNPFYTQGKRFFRAPIIAPLASSGLSVPDAFGKQSLADDLTNFQNKGVLLNDGNRLNYSFDVSLPSGMKTISDKHGMFSTYQKILMQNNADISKNAKMYGIIQKHALNLEAKNYMQDLIRYVSQQYEQSGKQIPGELELAIKDYYKTDPDFAEKMRQSKGAIKNRNIVTNTDQAGNAAQKEEEGEKKKEEKKEEEEEEEEEEDKTPDADDSSTGTVKGGKIRLSGWKAPRLYCLVRPMKIRKLGSDSSSVSKASEIEEQKSDLDQRRDMYREQQMRLRGQLPPNEMIKRAMPDNVEPIPDLTNTPERHHRLHVMPAPNFAGIRSFGYATI